MKATHLIPNMQKLWKLTASSSLGYKIFNSTKCQTDEWLSISFLFPQENKKTRMDESENEVIFTFPLLSFLVEYIIFKCLGICILQMVHASKNSCNLHLEKTSFPIKNLIWIDTDIWKAAYFTTIEKCNNIKNWKVKPFY